MTFLEPQLLWLLLVLPVLAGAHVALSRRNARAALVFTSVDLLDQISPSEQSWRRTAPLVLAALTVVSLVVGLARPQLVTTVPEEQAVVNIVLDVSHSMQAVDVAPSRLVVAQEAAANFVDGLDDGVRVGLVTFAGQANVVATPTTDRGLVKDAIEALTTDAGTAVGEALFQALTPRRQAVAAAETSSTADSTGRDGADAAPLVVVMLSDGSNTTGRTPDLATEEAVELEVPVFTISLGTVDGTVNLIDPDTNEPQEFSVPPDSDGMAAISEATGAQSFEAADQETLDEIYSSISSRIERVEALSDLTWAAMLAALVLFVAAAGTSLAWTRRVL